jgi:DNA-binding MarR family transcriptional regulator
MGEKRDGAEPAVQPLQQAIQAVRRLFHALSGTAERVHAELGVTAAMRDVLEILHGRGPRTVPQIAREKGVSRQHVQVIVNALLALGLVECVDNPDHLRSPLLRLSAAGTKACEAVRRREGRLLTEVAKRIPGSDLKVTLKTLNAMESGLSRADARSGSRV